MATRNTGGMENLQGNQDFLFGYWVFSKKHDIAILRRHSNAKTLLLEDMCSAWKQNPFSEVRVREGLKEVLILLQVSNPELTPLYFDMISLLYKLFSQTVNPLKTARCILKQKVCCTA